MNTPLGGGCACGTIRFECTEGPVYMLNCHCRNCQRAGGSAYSSSMIFSRSAFVLLAGKPKHFEKTVQSGNISSQGFCGDCGSPLYGLTSGHPEFIGVRAVSLDDTAVFAAQADVWVCEAQPWVSMNPATPKLQKSPEEI